MKINNAAIIGMGALGMLFGDAIQRAHGRDSVGFIVDAGRRARYESLTFTINGEACDFRLLPAEAPEKPADLVMFATKATGLDRAMEDAAGYIGPDTVLVSILNGVTSEGLLAERFGRRNIVPCVAQGMDATKNGPDLFCQVRGRLCVGAEFEEQKPALEALCEFLESCGIAYQREADIRHRIWSKFMLNVGVNQVVMVYEGTYDTIQQPGEARDMMINAMEEARQMAICEGIDVTREDLEGYVALMDTLTPSGMPSMRQDGLARRPSEVALFAETVCALSDKHGVPAPVNRWLLKRIREMEAEYR